MATIRRSRSVTLLLLGTLAAVQGCSDDSAPLQRQRYASREDCIRDWNDPNLCQPNHTGSSGGSGGGSSGWYGPRYHWSRRLAAPVVVEPDGSTRAAVGARIGPNGSTVAPSLRVSSISRGGFGWLGHLFAGAHG